MKQSKQDTIKKIDLIAYFTNSTSDIKSYENDFPKITFIGRLSETKGIRYLLESLLIIIKKSLMLNLTSLAEVIAKNFSFLLLINTI